MPFEPEAVEQLRVLKLVPSASRTATMHADWTGTSDLVVSGRNLAAGNAERQRNRSAAKTEWKLVETRTPLRLGKPLPLIPFVFHGPRHSLPDVDKLPLADIIAVNLDHYRLNADYKHGLHFTALPTAWVSGFDKTSIASHRQQHGLGGGNARRDGWLSGISRSRSDDL